MDLIGYNFCNHARMRKITCAIGRTIASAQVIKHGKLSSLLAAKGTRV